MRDAKKELNNNAGVPLLACPAVRVRGRQRVVMIPRMQQPHRKRARHYDAPGHVHELTFSCYRRLPLLTNDEWRQQLCTTIDRAVVRHHYRLLPFVLMPEHVHLVVHPLPDGSPVSDLLRAVKRPFSFRINQRLIETGSPLLERLTVWQGAMATALSGHAGGSRDTAKHAHAEPWTWHPRRFVSGRKAPATTGILHNPPRFSVWLTTSTKTRFDEGW